MHTVFSQYLLCRDPHPAEELKDARTAGFEGIEFCSPVMRGYLSRGASLADFAAALEASELEPEGTGALRLVPGGASEEARAELYDAADFSELLAQKTGSLLCSLEPYICKDDDELALYPEGAVADDVKNALLSLMSGRPCLRLSLCPDADPKSLVRGVAKAAEIIALCAPRRVWLTADTGLLGPEALKELELIPKGALALIRLGPDEEFNAAFLQKAAALGFDGPVATSSALAGSGERAQTLSEAHELIKKALVAAGA